MLASLLLLFSSIIMLHSGPTFTLPHDSTRSYKMRYLPKNDIRIDGELNDKGWQACEVIQNLSAPWDPGATGTARFRACYNDNFFYFSFNVRDSLGLLLAERSEAAVAKGDRVEVFFSPDTTMANYYCLEIAPNGNLLDYQASYHRKFNDTWNIEGAKIVGKRAKDGYVVEGKIPVSFFKKLVSSNGSLKGTTIYAGVFRARKKSSPDPEAFIWYSWIDPKVASPDFHIPSALGRFEF